MTEQQTAWRDEIRGCGCAKGGLGRVGLGWNAVEGVCGHDHAQCKRRLDRLHNDPSTLLALKGPDLMKCQAPPAGMRR